MSAENEELIDYEDEHDVGAPTTTGTSVAVTAAPAGGEKSHAGIHSTGFRYAIDYNSRNISFTRDF